MQRDICTPFNFVYGAGGVVIILCLRKRKKWREVFLIGSIGAGAVEYVLSFLEELFLGTRSWDYSDYFLNIDGRTNIPYMLFFGALCVVVVFLVWQPLNSWLDSLPKRVMKVLAVILVVIILADLLLTLAVQFRYSARMAGREPLTFIGEFFDRAFDDEYMRLHFPAKEFLCAMQVRFCKPPRRPIGRRGGLPSLLRSHAQAESICAARR